jgi:hypothetical protein
MELIHTAAEAVEIIMAGRTLVNDLLRYLDLNGTDDVRDYEAHQAAADVARFVVVDGHNRAMCISADDRIFLAQPHRSLVALQFPNERVARFALEGLEDQRPEDGPMAVRGLADYMRSQFDRRRHEVSGRWLPSQEVADPVGSETISVFDDEWSEMAGDAPCGG